MLTKVLKRLSLFGFALTALSIHSLANDEDRAHKHLLACEHLKECKYTKYAPLKEYFSPAFGFTVSLPVEFTAEVYPKTDLGEYVEGAFKQSVSEFLYESIRVRIFNFGRLRIFQALEARDKAELKKNIYIRIIC